MRVNPTLSTTSGTSIPEHTVFYKDRNDLSAISETSRNVWLVHCHTNERIETTSGSITIENGIAEGSISTLSGQIYLTDTQAHNTISTAGGLIEMNGGSAHHKIETNNGAIKLSKVNVFNQIRTTIGRIDIDSGTVDGSIVTDGGHVNLTGVDCRSSIRTKNGSIKLADVVSMDNIYTAQGKIELEETTAQHLFAKTGDISLSKSSSVKSIRTGSQTVTLKNSSVIEDVDIGSSELLSMQSSEVGGSIIARGNQMTIGADCKVSNIVLRSPQELHTNQDIQVAKRDGLTHVTAMVRGVPMTLIGGGLIQTSEASIMVKDDKVYVDGRLYDPSKRSSTNKSTAVIVLGKNSKLESIEFDAPTCKIVLGDGASFTGEMRPGLTVERESAAST